MHGIHKSEFSNHGDKYVQLGNIDPWRIETPLYDFYSYIRFCENPRPLKNNIILRHGLLKCKT